VWQDRGDKTGERMKLQGKGKGERESERERKEAKTKINIVEEKAKKMGKEKIRG
jgi:hypothetical protein